ncbi:MAG: hypothetical protein HUK02_09535, partial [Bacteroidaceae bacterium]|nr:hypothetical protein [Bacteroidaceae bacterium]
MINPVIWLCRLRHRCGYGVHSPFAFQLVTQVLYEQAHHDFYAYEWLDQQFSRWERCVGSLSWRRSRLLFRLANHCQPAVISAPGADLTTLSYLHQGCRRAELTAQPTEADLIYLREPDAEALQRIRKGGLLVVDRLPRHKTYWASVKQHPRVSVTFDLHHLG